MTGIFVTGFAFLTGFLAIFGVNLVLTDVFLKDRERVRKRLDEEIVQRQRARAREALAGQDLDRYGFVSQSGDDQFRTVPGCDRKGNAG